MEEFRSRAGRVERICSLDCPDLGITRALNEMEREREFLLVGQT